MPQVGSEKVKGVADVVFCIDVTGSMQPCIDALKANVGKFIEGLQAPTEIQGGTVVTVKDWRAKAFGFRDMDCDGPHAMIEDFPFVTTVDELKSQLADARMAAAGGGDEPESMLDALYRAAKNTPWRPVKDAHRFIVVFSDASTKSAMHPSTVGGVGPTDLQEVVQALQAQRIKPVFYTVKGTEALTLSNTHAKMGGVSQFFASGGEAHGVFQSEMAFAKLIERLAATVSVTTSEVL